MIQQTFTINDDEIVHGEYFSHTNEPILTFNPARGLVYVNAISLKRLPDMDYALLVISASEKRLSVFPCGTGERDAVRLRSGSQHQNKPRQIRCRVEFSEQMLSLMNWKRECRYRMIGYTAIGKYNTIITFDLSSAEAFSPGERTADALSQAQNRFGVSFDEQQNNPLIKIVEQAIEISTTELEENTSNEV